MRPLSFVFPPPHQHPQTVLQRDAEGSLVPSRVHLVNRPVSMDEEARLIRLCDEGYYLLGICAFENWPARIPNPFDLPATRGYDLFEKPYYRRFAGFMHNFREPGDVFPDDIPLLAMDFSDYVQVRKRGREKAYDLLYYAGYRHAERPRSVAWSSVVKQHDLALLVIRTLLDRYPDLRVAIVHDVFGIDDPRVTNLGFLPYREFLDTLEAARILLVPSVLDASPRVITEALCLDTHVMVNRDISGGWKYVNDTTGALFDRTDFLAVYERLRARGPAATRAWFLRNYPNHLLEARFSAWVNACIARFSAFNRFGRVLYLCSDGAAAEERAILRELYGHMGTYGGCVERVPAPVVPDHRAKGRARAHLAAIERAQALGLPDVVIVEDDFQFIAPRQAVNRKLTALLEGFPTWDAILLGNDTITAREATREAEVLRVRGTAMPHGYVVRAGLYDALAGGLAAAAEAMPDGEAEGEAMLGEVWARISASADVHAFRSPLGEGVRGIGPPRGRAAASCLDGAEARETSP